MIGFDLACSLISGLPERTRTELVPLARAAGRVLARDIVAGLDSPRHAVSAMDGYAVRDADLMRLPARLRVVGCCFAGQPDVPVMPPGCCTRVFTGAPLPPGADRVVIQEHVRREGEDAFFEVPLGSGSHIRLKSSDFHAGETLLVAGTRLDACAIVAAAAADEGEVEVYSRPRVIVLGTGDELSAPGSARFRAAAIPESVSFGAAAMAEQWGAICVQRRCLPDDLAQLECAAAEALEMADVVIVTGGASVGEKDYAKTMFLPHGLELIFSKVAIKPGKPVWLGRAAGKLVLGLPGNPASAMVTARLFLAPLLLRLSGGDPAAALRWRLATLAKALPSGGDRDTFARARWAEGRVMPLLDQDSSAQRALATAELLVRRGVDAPALDTGEQVEVLDF
ncbi:MAG TPA: molybdopterin molybdotransferase MoeA [Pseudoxanthomonas sp.]